MLLFHRQRDNLTEHLQIKFHHCLILIGGIECVTIAPWPYESVRTGKLDCLHNRMAQFRHKPCQQRHLVTDFRNGR